jgi:pimeloyl-ACP methyl ester carboxylesterase
LLPDKRGCEASEGDWRTSSFEDLATDTISAVSHLRAQLPQSIRVVAARSSDVAFVINVVGGAIPMHDVLLYEEIHNLRQMGFLPGFSNAIAHLSTFYLRNFSQHEFWSAIGNFDPLPYWQQVDVPTLPLYEDRDTNVPSEESRERLSSLAKPNLRVVVFEGSGHGLEAPEGIAGNYIREDALELVRDFILAAAPVD